MPAAELDLPLIHSALLANSGLRLGLGNHAAHTHTQRYLMTLEHIFFLSQTGAALGVVASLIFVGIQVRDGAKAIRSATAQAVHEN